MLKNKESHKLFRNLKLKRSHKSLRNLKSQAALEFLVTYSWALLAILITIGALYYYGIFDFGRYLPQRCLFTSQLECLDFVMKGPPDNQVTFRLNNNLGEQIIVDSISITNDATPSLSCTAPTVGSDWDPGDEQDFAFTSCSGGGFIEDERVEAKIILIYYSPLTNPGNEPRHTVNGKIQGSVQ